MAVLPTHDSNITINITLAPAPADGNSFGIVCHFVPLATNSLNGVVVASYTSDAEAAAALTAGYIESSTRVALGDAFSQIPKPPIVKVASIDLIGGDFVNDAYAAAILVDRVFYCVTMVSKIDADILLISAAVEADRRICVVQSDEATWLTAGYPPALTDLEDRERTIVVYHDADTENGDLAWATSRLAHNPDVKSAPWNGKVREVAILSALTSAEKALLLANDANVGLRFGTDKYYMFEGTNCAGRPIAHIITMDWIFANIQDDLINLIASLSADGRKLTVDDDGQALGLQVIESRLQQAVGAGHLSDYEISNVLITQTHRDDGELPYLAAAVLTTGAVKITLDLNLSTSPLT